MHAFVHATAVTAYSAGKCGYGHAVKSIKSYSNPQAVTAGPWLWFTGQLLTYLQYLHLLLLVLMYLKTNKVLPFVAIWL